MSQKAQARLTTLAARLKPEEKAQSGKTPKSLSGEATNPNPPHGTRGEFVKVSVSLPGALLEAVGSEALRRKRFKLPNATVGAVLREAVAEWATKHRAGEGKGG